MEQQYILSRENEFWRNVSKFQARESKRWFQI